MRKREQDTKGRYCCPCCGFATLSEANSYEICVVCAWEDDGQDDPEQNENWGGPNNISLTDGRINFIVTGQSDPKRKLPGRDPSEFYEKLRNYSIAVVENEI